MPTTIILLLATAPVLTLSMISATDWSSETLAAARLALAASLVIVVLWVVVDAIRALSGRWRQFTSRPY
jgi:hypothetical protein